MKDKIIFGIMVVAFDIAVIAWLISADPCAHAGCASL